MPSAQTATSHCALYPSTRLQSPCYVVFLPSLPLALIFCECRPSKEASMKNLTACLRKENLQVPQHFLAPLRSICLVTKLSSICSYKSRCCNINRFPMLYSLHLERPC